MPIFATRDRVAPPVTLKKNSKKKGAAHNLLFLFACKGRPLCGQYNICAAKSPRAVSCAVFLDLECLSYSRNRSKLLLLLVKVFSVRAVQ
jgi:hypothetical protein